MKQIFMVYGYTSDDHSYIWEVCGFEKQELAEEFCKQVKLSVEQKFNSELANGFSIGDSISVQTVLDPKAKYTRYHKKTDDTYGIDTEYLTVSLPIFDTMPNARDLDLMRKLQGKENLKPSIKWPTDDSVPDDWEEDTYSLIPFM